MSAPMVVIGVGNEYRRDDGVGPAVVALLQARDLPASTYAESDGEPIGLIEPVARTPNSPWSWTPCAARRAPRPVCTGSPRNIPPRPMRARRQLARRRPRRRGGAGAGAGPAAEAPAALRRRGHRHRLRHWLVGRGRRGRSEGRRRDRRHAHRQRHRPGGDRGCASPIPPRCWSSAATARPSSRLPDRTQRVLLAVLDEEPPVCEGDWLLVQSGIALARLDPSDAAARRDLLDPPIGGQL